MNKKPVAEKAISSFTIPSSAPQTTNPMEKAKLDAGALGKFFGTSENASNNIIGLTAVLTMIMIIIIAFLRPDIFITCLSYTAPILTTILGYLMGSKLRTK